MNTDAFVAFFPGSTNFARYHRNISGVARSALISAMVKNAGRSPKRARISAIKKEEAEIDVAAVPDIEDAVPHIPAPPDSVTVLRILQHLRDAFGGRSLSSKTTDKPVLDSLIHTLLTQATNDNNSERAFAALKSTYPTWEAVLEAPVSDVADTIRIGGLANQKSVRIQNILRVLSETPSGLSLEYMRGEDTEEIKRALNAFPGVGNKTIAVVLMMCLSRGEFPVDTHVRRICGRLGWTKLKETPDNVYKVMNAALDDEVKYELHMLFLEHGRRYCKAQRPKCNECPLTEDCQFFKDAQQLRLEPKTADEDDGAHEYVDRKKSKVKKEEDYVPSVVVNTTSTTSTRSSRSRTKMKEENELI